MSTATKFMLARLLEGGEGNVPAPTSLNLHILKIESERVTIRITISDELGRELAQVTEPISLPEGGKMSITNIHRSFHFTLKGGSE